MDDFRLAVGFLDHHKIVRLRLRLGDEAIVGFIGLLALATTSKNDGNLADLDEEAIFVAAKLRKLKVGKFVETLVELKLLDRDTDGALSIHGWAEHNPFAASAAERSAQARDAARMRWAGKAHKAEVRDACAPHSETHANSIRPAMLGAMPSSFLSDPDLSVSNSSSSSSGSSMPDGMLAAWENDDDEWLRNFLRTQTSIPAVHLWNREWWDALAEAVDGLDLKALGMSFAKIKLWCNQNPARLPADTDGWRRLVSSWLLDEHKKASNGAAKR